MVNIHSLLDSDKQTRAREYEIKKRRISFSNLILGFILALIFILFISQPLLNLLPKFPAFRFVFFLWVLALFSLPFDLILSFRSGYKLEHEFGFSNQNKRQFFKDEFKGHAINLLINPLLALILFLAFRISSELWWLWAACAMIFISVIFATLYPVVIMPLFNKYTPIKDEELTTKLGAILSKGGLKIKGFFLQDMSRQTKKENAFLGGLGKTRRVVLSDNIISNMSLQELEAVLAHEVGHYKNKHMWKNILLGAVYQLIIFFLSHQIMIKINPDFFKSLDNMLLAYPVFLLCFGVFHMLIIGPLSNAVSRFFERQADRYALDMTHNPDAFQKAMAGLANRNLSNAYPTPFIKFMYYSHPPVGERLEMGDAWRSQHEHQET
ncbi:MAG: M48 family metallopeptidase [Candidatus Marinimicrobia bacterium]|nr:M48 family metallopeptidase [Candidatus Neomarinimicrobiota bacterium]